jgi:iron complex transport system substrate-binding protein
MWNRRAFLGALVAGAVWSARVAAAASTPLVRGAGSDVSTQTPPARIVSTSPSVTEMLFAMGLGDRVVGVSTYCRYPAVVAALPKVGTFLRPDAELIARLRPDLVFLEPGPNTAPAQLQSLGIRATVVGGVTDLAGVLRTIEAVGSAAGTPERARELITGIDAELGRVKRAVGGRARRKILLIVGRRTGTLSDIIAVGPGSYLDDIAKIAGGTNVLASVAVAYPRISMESVITLAPDVIVDIGEMGETPADSARRMRATETLWRGQPLVRAARDGNVRATVDEAFVVPGPRVIDAAWQFAEWLHGTGRA